MKIALVTIRNEIKNMYMEELNNIFSDYLEIIPYSMEVDHKYIKNSEYLRSADVILLTNPDLYSIIKNMTNESAKILYLDYSFLKNKIESLRFYPENTKALVCFNFHEVSVQAVTTIYEMGITNLNLTTYNPNSTSISDEDFDIAIVGESSAIVPDKIETIVSLGRRKISFKTLVDLAVTTNILDDKLENRIYQYSLETANPNNFINNFYSNSSYYKGQLKTIMDSIDYSIITLDNNYKILNYNKNLKEMFDLKDDILYKKISDLNEFKSITDYIESDKIKNKLIEISNDKKVMMTIQKIYNTVIKEYSYIILLRDVTEIMILENTLKKQLTKKGYVTKHDFTHIYGHSDEIKNCIQKAKAISKLDKTLLILGESGTGKEIFAQSVHNESQRKNYPFIGINCASIPSTLLESELFGYEEGTFTGAKKGGKEGLFQLANNGTLFLDEIGDISLEIQAKLLRVLEEKEVMKLGSGEIKSVNVRIITATNRDLKTLIKEGHFRLDLYYRLNAFTLSIPPLRKRIDDIHYLINLFIKEESNSEISIDKDVLNFLLNYTWPGNVRELKNCVEYMVNLSDGHIDMNHIPDYIMEDYINYKSYDLYKEENTDDIFYSLNGYEKKIALSILEEIEKTGGGRRSIFDRLKINYNDLSEYKMRNLIDIMVEYGLIQFGAGRQGMKITNKGRALI